MSKDLILPPDIDKAVMYILENIPDAVFGGSIALKAMGLLNRDPHDIDLFFHRNTLLTKNKFIGVGVAEIGSESVTDVNGDPVQRTSITILGVKTCAFKVRNEELYHSVVTYKGLPMRIQHANHAINAKRTYKDTTGKHKADLQEVEATLTALFS